jgi:membrane protein DedA with SNARE-associated domain
MRVYQRLPNISRDRSLAPDMEHHILAWIAQYGYLAIFILLVFGIVGLPVPDETLLTFTGYLVFKGKLELWLAAGTALAGSISGITISYRLGRSFGMPLVRRYGRYLHLKEEHINKAHAWFERIGHWALTFGYFIPGVRHVTAFAAGISQVPSPQFAAYAYSGAVLWVSAFISLGYFLGERWEAVQKNVDHYLVASTAAGAILLAGYLYWRKRRRGRGK